MVAQVAWIAARGKWYLVDRHPKHPSGRRTWVLGPSEEDRVRGDLAAKAINEAREEGQLAQHALEGDGPPLGAIVLRAWWEAARHGLAPSTQITIEKHLRLRLLPFFGAVDLRKLSREDVKRFGGQAADKGLGQHSIAGALATLRRALRWAVEQNVLEREPVQRVVRLGLEAGAARGARRGRREAWSRDEVARILELAQSTPHLRSVVLAACQTGARKGELLALRWSAVDFSGGRIAWSASRWHQVEKSTKANKIRYGQLSDELAAELREIQRRRPPERRFRDQGDDLVFLDRRGRPWHYDSLSTAWKRLRARAELRGVRPLPFHSFRHTFVSWALAAGVDTLWVADQIGDRPETMLRCYAHLVRGTAPDLSFLRVSQEPLGRSPARAAPASER